MISNERNRAEMVWVEMTWNEIRKNENRNKMILMDDNEMRRDEMR